MQKERGKGKKGQEITLGTIILIVLGIAVLVFLIWGFSAGWGNFWGKISAMFGGGANVDLIKLGCDSDCKPGYEQAFCVSKRPLKYEDSTGLQKVSISCDDIRNGQYASIVKIESCSITPEQCVAARASADLKCTGTFKIDCTNFGPNGKANKGEVCPVQYGCKSNANNDCGLDVQKTCTQFGVSDCPTKYGCSLVSGSTTTAVPVKP